MKKLLFTILFAILFSVSVYSQGANVNLSTYATCGDADNTAGFQLAINAIKTANGGTINIDACATIWRVAGELNFYTASSNISYRLQGNYGSIIKLETSSIETLFTVVNANLFVIDGVTFIGINPTNSAVDGKTLLLANQTDYVKITNCYFLGLRFASQVIDVATTNFIMDTCYFGGVASPVANVYALDAYGINITNSKFHDYGYLNGVLYTKSSYNTGNWIKIDNNPNTYNLNSFGLLVIIDNVRFDEGGLPSAVYIRNAKSVTMANLAFSLPSITGASGIVFDNVSIADINNAYFGYTTVARPAFVLLNDSKVNGVNLIFNSTVYLANRDNNSKISLSDGETFAWKYNYKCNTRTVKCI